MYQDASANTKVPKENLSIATDFANVMIEKFSETEQNEILVLIRQIWSERRLQEIEKMEIKISSIRESLSCL